MADRYVAKRYQDSASIVRSSFFAILDRKNDSFVAKAYQQPRLFTHKESAQYHADLLNQMEEEDGE